MKWHLENNYKFFFQFTLSVPKADSVKEETIKNSAVADNTIEEEDTIEEDNAQKEIKEKAAEKVFWIPQKSSRSSSSLESWPESSLLSQMEAEEEYQRAEKVPEVSAHSLKKTDMDLSVRDSSFSSSGIPLSPSLLLPVILSLALLRDN